MSRSSTNLPDIGTGCAVAAASSLMREEDTTAPADQSHQSSAPTAPTEPNDSNLPQLASAAVKTNVKYISLSTPLVLPRATVRNKYEAHSGTDEKPRPNTSVRLPLRHRVLYNLPAKATLHREKQITGRFFPKPSYTDSQRVSLEQLRPINHSRIVRRLTNPTKPRLAQQVGGSLLVYTPSGVRQKTIPEQSSWVAARVFARGTTHLSGHDKSSPSQGPSPVSYLYTSSESHGDAPILRQSSIPPSQSHQGEVGGRRKASSTLTGRPAKIHRRSHGSEMSSQHAALTGFTAQA